MAWRLKKVEEQRKNLVEAYLQGKLTMNELCEQFDVSRKTAYKWCSRYKCDGEEGLKDRSKAPHYPNNVYNEDVIVPMLKFKQEHPAWGSRKVIAKLRKKYPEKQWPSPTRAYEVFRGHGLVVSRRLRRKVPATQPLGEVNKSNDVWILDFKGWFLTQDKSKCEPLTITDGFSRYLIRCKHLYLKSSEYVWAVLVGAFQEYGLPNRIRTDNGPPFGSTGIGRLTPLSIKIIKAGVIPEWINPGHPEENGRHERFHLTLKKEIASPPASTMEEQLKRMRLFEEEYNFERPHEALRMDTPGNYYQSSSRKWDGVLRAPEYDTQSMFVRKVGQNGCIWIKQTEYYVSQNLTGEYIGISENEEGLKTWYGPVYLGKLEQGKKHIERPKLHRKKIVRRS